MLLTFQKIQLKPKWYRTIYIRKNIEVYVKYYYQPAPQVKMCYSYYFPANIKSAREFYYIKSR